MAAVVCRTGTKAQTEFSTEKLRIKKIFQHIIGTGRSRGAFCYRLVWAKKVSLAAICLVAGSASFGTREN